MDNRKYIKLYQIHYEYNGLFSFECIKASNIISACIKFKKHSICKRKIVKIEKIKLTRCYLL